MTVDQIIFRNVPLSAAQQALIDGTSNPTRAWARINIMDNGREEGTISNSPRRYDNFGVLLIELYTPSGDGGALANKTLIPAIRNAFEDSRLSSLWFRKVRSVPVGPDGAWFHYNILADFEWDEVR